MTRCMMVALGVTMGVAKIAALNAQEYTMLHHFSGQPGDAARPWGSLTLDGEMLYGMTRYGGAGECLDDVGHGCGAAFRVGTDGGGYRIIHDFRGGFGDGSRPWGSLLLHNGLLYGMTENGGRWDSGVHFSMSREGVYEEGPYGFMPPNYGDAPLGGFACAGTRLYGMTSAGGEHDAGLVFSCGDDFMDPQRIHHFRGGPGDGAEPWGTPVLGGGRLYGMTRMGGARGYGAIFSMRTDGTGHRILHSFGGWPEDGARPLGSLILDGDTLYGMTPYGGMHNEGYAPGYGTIFSVRTDGSSYTVLHHFSRAAADGSGPCGNLLLREGRLYGLAYRGGASDNGGIFSIGTNGSDFDLLHSFAGGPGDGAHAMASLVTDGVFLYGMTNQGGEYDRGVIFSFEIPSADPPIDLTPNGNEFGRTDHISVTADVQPIEAPFQPYVRVIFPDGHTLYYVRGEGFTAARAPYLPGGAFTVGEPIRGYGVLDADYTIVETGVFVLEGFAEDAAGNVIGVADSHELVVR